MKYYILYSNFIKNEAIFNIHHDVKLALDDQLDLSVKYFDIPPMVFIDNDYKERELSDVIKSTGFHPNKKVVDIFRVNSISGVQFIPVSLDVNGFIYKDFYYLNVYETYAILNVNASKAKSYHKRYDAYLDVNEIVLDRGKIKKEIIKHDMFRLSEYPMEIIVTEKIKNILEINQFTGLECVPVEVR